VFVRTINDTQTPYTLRVTGFSPLNSARTRAEDDTSASLIDDVSYNWGRHAIKAGFQARRIHMNPASSQDGTLTYTTRELFAGNQLDSASVTGVLPMKRLRKTHFFGFVQDQIRVTPDLTVNAGLRYSYFDVFSETQGRAVPFDFYTCGGFCPPGSEFSQPRTNDLDPRLSVAWAPRRLGGRTVLRAGFGVYHGDGQLEDQNLPASNDVPRYSLNSRQTPSLAFPIDSILAQTPGTLSPRAQNRRREDQYSTQWTASVQQALPLRFIATATYMGNKGTNLQTISALNLLDPVTGKRPFADFGQVEYRTNESNSTFHSLLLGARRYFQNRWLVDANYMWSHSINDGSLGGGEADIMVPQNTFCRACENASSAQDIRHYFTLNTVYEIPAISGALKPVLSDWSISMLTSARTGRPVNVTISRAATVVPGGYNQLQRPDVVPGVSPIPAQGQTAVHWFEASAFRVPAPGTWGNLGRDALRGPGLYQIDVGLSRKFRFSERVGLELRAEVFNVLNRAQLADPSGDVTVPDQFGVIRSTINTGPVGTGTPRQIQFLLRLRL
jgi:hypothetical protein